MVDGGLFDVYWTPDFTDDVTTAVAYVAEELGSPIAARNLLEGVTELLDSKRAMPTAATWQFQMLPPSSCMKFPPNMHELKERIGSCPHSGSTATLRKAALPASRPVRSMAKPTSAPRDFAISTRPS